MNEEITTTGDDPKAPPPEAPKPAKPARLLWKAVEPRHYAAAQAIESKPAQRAYIVSLLEAVDGVVLNEERRGELGKEIVAQAVAEFEEKYGGKE